jgi:hypothetical protein
MAQDGPIREFGRRKPVAASASQKLRRLLPHGSSGGVYGRSSRFFGGDSSGHGSSATSSDAASSGVRRGGFGSFAPAFGFFWQRLAHDREKCAAVFRKDHAQSRT